MNEEVNHSADNRVILSKKEYNRLTSEITYLKEQLAEIRRLMYGAKSERFVQTETGQTSLFATGEDQASATTKQIEGYSRSHKSKKQAVRTALPAHLAREETIIEPEVIPEGAVKIGEEVTEILEYKPSSLYVKRFVRPKYVDRQADSISIGDLPDLPIPRSNAGAGLLAHLLISKYADHLPFYRQIKMFKRQGVHLKSSTIDGWFMKTVDLLQPLYDCLKSQILEADYLQADESPLKVLESERKNATHQGYMWLYHAPTLKKVLFDYQKGRGREGPQQMLGQKKEHLYLQTDAYSAYDKLRTESTIEQLGCMAHARRRFDQARKNDRKRAEYVMKLLQHLYDMEREAREKELSPEERKALREKQAKPVLITLENWLVENSGQVTPKSAIGTAIAYCMHNWKRLTGYLKDGRFEIDNNLIENQVRPLALGRKNYLFAGSHQAAHGAAILYSMLGTCQLQGIEPFQWLKTTLEKLPATKTSKLYELLPGYMPA